MPTIDSLETLLVNELRDLLDAEMKITKALPKMVKAAESEELRAALEQHLSQTEGQISRLEKVFRLLEAPAKPKPCHGMRGLLEEGNEHMKEDYTDPALSDAAIIGAAQKVEHYEIAGYGTAATFARLLGHDEIVEILGQTLQEEKDSDLLLTQIAEAMVNPAAAMADDEEESESRSSRGGSRSRSGSRSGSRSKTPARSTRNRSTKSGR